MLVVNAAVAQCWGKGIPEGYELREDTLSPYEHYGVLIPHYTDGKFAQKYNKVFDLTTSQVVCDITPDPRWAIDEDIGCEQPTGWDRTLNHHEKGTAQWSWDSSVLVWTVDSKWGYDGFVVLKFADGKLQWRRDMLALCHKSIITRMRSTAPKDFKKGSDANKGDGCWYPRGYAVDQKCYAKKAKLPMEFVVGATSNVKNISDFPTVEAHMNAVLNEDGSFVVTDFGMGRGEQWVFE